MGKRERSKSKKKTASKKTIQKKAKAGKSKAIPAEFNLNQLLRLNQQVSSLKVKATGQQLSGGVADSTNTLTPRPSVLSPLAYLADLLDYARNHLYRKVRQNRVPVTLEDLEGYCYQPFGELPANIEALEKTFAQIRICIEVLRAYLGERPLDDPQKEALLASAEAKYLDQAYSTLLQGIGTSVEEIELVSILNDDAQKTLAERLSIPQARLEQLWLDKENRTEASLERLFGLQDSSRDVLSDGAKSGDPEGQITRWDFQGVIWNRNTDVNGKLYLTLKSDQPSQVVVEVYRDAERTELLARGTGTSGTAEIMTLDEQNESGLSGNIGINFSTDNLTIEIAILPELLAWQLQYLRNFWLQADHETGSIDHQPIIDPDLIAKVYIRSGYFQPSSELWQKRRNWIDDQLSGMQETRKNATYIWGKEGPGDGELDTPKDIAVDSSGNIYVADCGNFRVQKFDMKGNFILKWGKEGPGNGQFASEFFGITVDSNDYVYVVDQQNHRVQKFSPDGDFLGKWGEYGPVGGQLNYPFGIAVDTSGNVFLADKGNHRIAKFDNEGNFLAAWGEEGGEEGEFREPNDVALDSQGNIYVADMANDRIQKFDQNGEFVLTWGSTGREPGKFQAPIRLDVDRNGYVYVADINNHRVQKFDGSGQFLHSWDGSSRFNRPNGVATDALGNLYIVEALGNRIQRLWANQEASNSFQVLLQGVLGLSTADLADLSQQRQYGDDISVFLNELLLPENAFNYLLHLQKLLDAGKEITPERWEGLESILVQVLKRRQFNKWRIEEAQLSLTLSPDFFKIDSIETAAVVLSDLPKWRASERQHRIWVEKLNLRIRQDYDLVDDNAKMIRAAAENALPILRKGLIEATGHNSRWLSENLLINCEYASDIRLTRIDQATVTIQQLLLSVRNGLLLESRPELALHAANFLEEWKWLGTYESWLSAMMVVLYPENLLDPILQRETSPLLTDIMKRWRKSRNLSRESIDTAVVEYEDYFKDVCDIKVEASCQAYTEYVMRDRIVPKNLCYEFGLSNGSVYWATHDGTTQSYWEKVPSFHEFKVTSIVGATPYKTNATDGLPDEGERFLYVFVTGHTTKGTSYRFQRGLHAPPLATQSQYQTLAFARFDLKAHTWSEDHTALSRPGGINPAILMEQAEGESNPPAFSFNDPTGPAHERTHVYFSNLNQEGTDWAGEMDSLNMLMEVNIKALVRSKGKKRLIYVNDNAELMIGLIRRDQWGNFSLINIKPLTDGVIRGEFEGVIQFSSALLWCLVKETYAGTGQHFYFRINLVGDDVDILPALNPPLPIKSVAIHNGNSKEYTKPFGIKPDGVRLLYETTSEVTEYHQAFVTPGNDDKMIFHRAFQVVPAAIVSREIHLKPTKDSRRREIIEAAFNNNPNAGQTIHRYFWEAFYFLPVYAALRLQRSQRYIDAKDYFRTVFDYALPPDEQKIFYGLRLEEDLDEDFERAKDWLLDPLNPHAIAATRRNAYTYYTISALVQCFLQEADAAFTHDTIESLAKARTLYTTSLQLLNEIVLPKEMDLVASNGEATAASMLDLLRSKSARRIEIQTDKKSSEASDNNSPALTVINSLLTTVHSDEFEIPENPLWRSQLTQAEIQLSKLNSGRNIAGDEREIQSTVPKVGLVPELLRSDVGDFNSQGSITFRPTSFRYAVLIERARQLVAIAQQVEAAFLSALEKFDVERLNLLNAENDLQLAHASVRLQDLRVTEAFSGVQLAELQKVRAQIQRDHFQYLLDEGWIASEKWAFGLLIASAALHTSAAVINGINAIKAAITFGIFGDKRGGAEAASSLAAAASTTASVLQMYASFERRRQEWALQRNLANQDVRIGSQQVQVAHDRVRVVNQERNIAELRSNHAQEVAQFLTNKFTNDDLYDFMSNVLEGVYAFFLQQATASAQLAANQLAFERQQTMPPIIQANYWEYPETEQNNAQSVIATPDRQGITGSARLLQDIYQLDQYAFETDQRKLQLTRNISLSQMAPAEFQRFRETGLIQFYTPQELFDRDFPGHYLRLVKRVRISVIALIPPTEGIKATLSTSGISRVVISDGFSFKTTEVRRSPESVALTSPLNATGLFELQEEPGKLLPFEGIGVDTAWQFEMPKASNFFDYNTIADVIISMDYTALNSFEYQQQVIQRLNRNFSADRAFSFRQQFADQWYDLHNPEQTATPMVVSFKTEAEDFPPNIENLKVQQVVMFFVRKDGETEEVELTYLHYTEEGAADPIGGGAVSTDGVISTRRPNGASWLPMIGKSPFGTWELAFPGNEDRFKNGEIEDILFVITCNGLTPEWPV